MRIYIYIYIYWLVDCIFSGDQVPTSLPGRRPKRLWRGSPCIAGLWKPRVRSLCSFLGSWTPPLSCLCHPGWMFGGSGMEQLQKGHQWAGRWLLQVQNYTNSFWTTPTGKLCLISRIGSRWANHLQHRQQRLRIACWQKSKCRWTQHTWAFDLVKAPSSIYSWDNSRFLRCPGSYLVFQLCFQKLFVCPFHRKGLR